MSHILWEMFSWPGGNVVGNLLASALWAAPAVAHLDRLARKHHAQHQAAIGARHCPGCDGDHG